MPRGRGGGFQGNWGSYSGRADAGSGAGADEEAIAQAVDEMFSMCGNAGQETMVGEHLADFDEWAMEALEDESALVGYEDFVQLVINDWYEGRLDKWEGTQLIWERGYGYMAQQSGHHDKADEVGEGRGQEF